MKEEIAVILAFFTTFFVGCLVGSTDARQSFQYTNRLILDHCQPVTVEKLRAAFIELTDKGE